MLVHERNTRTEWAKELTGYWRELLFWMLLLPAFGALGSIRPRRQVAGLVEACAFLLVAISSSGKLKSLGLEFANWNRRCRIRRFSPLLDGDGVASQFRYVPP